MMIPWRQYNHRVIDSNTILCLDIEVSSFWIHKGKIIEWDKNLSDDFYNSECEKGSCVYIWMFGVEDTIYYGREWDEFPEFLAMIKEDAVLKNEKDKIYIYIHNFSYEFQFLLNFDWEFDAVFARQMRKPMKADFDIFQFRCSYVLTNLSLESWGKQLGVQKLKGQLDYIILRSPKTPLFDYELEYCEEDIHVMLVGLAKYREKYGKIKSIPLTATGEVRKVVRKMYHKNVGYLKKTTRMLPRTEEEYKISKAVFGGGDTHANVQNVNKVVEDAAGKDECSAYPFFMCVGSYPTSRFTKTIERDNFDFDKFCYIFLLKITGAKLKYKISYLARSRCISVSGGVYDNGRIVSGDIVLYCTEYDLKYIKYFYDGEYEFLTVRKAIKGHLDKQYVNYILDLFNDKTTLKNVKGMEDLYQQQKSYLNSLYGMMVTDIVMPEVSFKNREWSAIGQLQKSIQPALDNLQEKWYKNILSYNHGIYVTSQARAGLWEAITAMIEAGGEEDILYYDTDSLKMAHPEKYVKVWDKLNKKRLQMLKEAAKRYKIPLDRFMPTAPNGKKSILGEWSDDGEYKKFLTLGAKKYCYEDDDGLHLTVSGVPKSAVKCLNGDITRFKDGFIFDSDTCRKGLATYMDGNNWKGTFIDGYELDQPYGLNLRNIGYTLGLTEEFKAYVQLIADWGNI